MPTQPFGDVCPAQRYNFRVIHEVCRVCAWLTCGGRQSSCNRPWQVAVILTLPLHARAASPMSPAAPIHIELAVLSDRQAPALNYTDVFGATLQGCKEVVLAPLK